MNVDQHLREANEHALLALVELRMQGELPDVAVDIKRAALLLERVRDTLAGRPVSPYAKRADDIQHVRETLTPGPER